MSGDAAFLSLSEIAAAIAAKRISSREATQACLDRIAQWQSHLNAFIAIDADEALREADEADAEHAKGRSRGPLHGVPLAHKDMFYDQGRVVTCGSLIRRDWIADSTATVLTRLRDAGAIRLGTLQMAEFAYGPTGHNLHFGPVHNPWHVDHITGGSSSGSGAAVAARLTFAALGSDTGGSIRMPAHFCGVTGLKTTVGRVSRAHAMPLSQSLDTIGPLARSAQDCALIFGLIAGADPADPTCTDEAFSLDGVATAKLCGVRIGVPSSFYVEDLDNDTARVLDETITMLKREGCEIITVTLPDQPTLSTASQIVLAAEAAAFHKRWMAERSRDYSPQVLMRLQNGLAISAVTYLETLRWRGAALAAHLQAVANVDAVLAPVCPQVAPTILESDVGADANAAVVLARLTRFTRPVNYLGLPSLALPCGVSTSGLPVGLQMIGRPFDEAGLLRIGVAFQRATDFHTRCPELP